MTSQRHSALISSDSEYFQVCFSAVHYLKISEQRWFSSEQRWKRKFSELKISAETALIFSETELIQSWTALIFSETALKLKIFRAKKSALNQRCFSADFLWNRADFLWNSAETPNFQSKKSALNQSCFSADFLWNRAEQRWFSLKQRWKTKISEQKNQLWKSELLLFFSVHFLLKTLHFSLFSILQDTCDQEAWEKGGDASSNFWLNFRREDFFHSWYTPKEHVFRVPNTFSNLYEALSSVSQFVLIQRWTALIQRKPALNSSETALISAGFLNPFWNSADQRWNL